MADSRDLEKIASSLVGTPFAHHGRDPQTGLDCFGLFILVMREIGKEIPDAEYDEGWARQGLDLIVKGYHNYVQPITEAEARPGDGILFMHFPGVGNHIGILLENGRFLHCSRNGVVIERLSDGKHRRRVEGFYRIIGENENA